jgi:hypothetical protein
MFGPLLIRSTQSMWWRSACRLIAACSCRWVDGVVVKQIPSTPYFSRGWAMDIALSFGLRPPLHEQPNATGFPTTFYVDYIRVWQRIPESQ